MPRDSSCRTTKHFSPIFPITLNTISKTHSIPKLEKLAAEFHTRASSCVDVNKVPRALKMPRIQVFKDGEMNEEVIGGLGHKGWLVVEEAQRVVGEISVVLSADVLCPKSNFLSDKPSCCC